MRRGKHRYPWEDTLIAGKSRKSGFPALARKITKGFLQTLPTDKDALVVASFGRAGSTLIYDALVDAMARRRFGMAHGVLHKAVEDRAFGLGYSPLRPGVIYKTHAHPTPLIGRRRVRAVFLFGSAVDAALSVHAQKDLRGEDWVKMHFEHLHRPYRYDDLLKADVLGIRDQCIAWMGFEDVPVLCMRYEGLWDNARQLSEFCGLEVKLPTRRARTPKVISPDAMAAARNVYGPLDEDMAKLPDCFVAAATFGEQMAAAAPSNDVWSAT